MYEVVITLDEGIVSLPSVTDYEADQGLIQFHYVDEKGRAALRAFQIARVVELEVVLVG